jgi:serpin B
MPNPTGSSLSQKSIRSEKSRQSAPQVSKSDHQALAAGDHAFALELYHALGQASSQNNFFYSPYSISLALAMTYAGANGETARQMAETLHFNLPPARLHPAFNALDQEIATRKDNPGQGSDGKGFRLNVANDIWGQQDYHFLPDFLDLLANNYGAGLRPVDFKSNPEAARKAINDNIARKTEQRIKDLIPAGALDVQTRLVLTNAIYFNAAWQYRFSPSLTENKPFTRQDGSQVTVPFMSLDSFELLSYKAGADYQAIALPYEGGILSMLILIPEAGKFSAFETGLDAARLDHILQSMELASTRVVMPKFKNESEFSLKQSLSELGMKDAFIPFQADFSGMDGNKANLYISDAIHKSFVKVDENGTEAAAATGIVIKTVSAPSETVTLTIDRPFIFLIRDEPTNTILFAGRVLDPSK